MYAVEHDPDQVRLRVLAHWCCLCRLWKSCRRRGHGCSCGGGRGEVGWRAQQARRERHKLAQCGQRDRKATRRCETPEHANECLRIVQGWLTGWGAVWMERGGEVKWDSKL